MDMLMYGVCTTSGQRLRRTLRIAGLKFVRELVCTLVCTRSSCSVLERHRSYLLRYWMGGLGKSYDLGMLERDHNARLHVLEGIKREIRQR